MFEQKRWGEIAELKYGKALSGYREDTEANVPVFGTNGAIGFTRLPQVNRPGVIIGRKGAYRGVHYSPVPFSVIDTAYYLEPHVGIDNRWAYYALQLADINGLDSGSAIPSTTRESFYSIPVRVPRLALQEVIAEVLGALDDKIDANTKLITTADKLSHALFLSMVRTGDQFVPLSDTAKFVNGKAFTKNASGTGRMVIRIAELNSGIGGSTVYNDIDVDDQHLARPGDLLFAWSGSLTLHRWFRPEGIVNQHIFKVMPQADYSHWLVYELLRHKLEEFKSIAADKATTMGHIQRRHLDEPVAVPPLGKIRKHNDVMTGLWDGALAAEVENLKLITTRDALLPQLMSGKLRVKDAEKVLDDVGV